MEGGYTYTRVDVFASDFHYGSGVVPLRKGVYSAYAKLAKENVKGVSSAVPFLWKGVFLRRGLCRTPLKLHISKLSLL